MNRRSECRWGLYPIVDAAVGGRPHAVLAEAVLRAGARVIQLRDKKASFEEMLEIGRVLRRLTRESGATFIVNDNPYLARELDADGVHIGQGDFPARIVRDVMGDDKIVGLSTHNQTQIVAAASLPVDYIGIGPVFATASKESEWPVVGTNLLRWAKQNSAIPAVAIGGITEKNLSEVASTGVDNFALIGDLMKAVDVEAKARRLIEIFAAGE
jgi:thiamine-phosphate pyrophosphorylase